MKEERKKERKIVCKERFKEERKKERKKECMSIKKGAESTVPLYMLFKFGNSNAVLALSEETEPERLY